MLEKTLPVQLKRSPRTKPEPDTTPTAPCKYSHTTNRAPLDHGWPGEAAWAVYRVGSSWARKGSSARKWLYKPTLSIHNGSTMNPE